MDEGTGTGGGTKPGERVGPPAGGGPGGCRPDQGRLDVEEGPSREEHLAQVLETWWLTQAEKEIERTVPKAVEYGAADLEVMGAAMLHLVPKERRSRQTGLEMALAFYALGKVARLFGAFERGDLPSEDTWFDLGVYCRMAERVREFGEWLPSEGKKK